MLYPITALYVSGSALAEPALKAICSKSVPDDRQGLLQGVFGSIGSVAIIIGPLAASMMLANVSGPAPLTNLPGIWFFIGSILFVLALAVTSIKIKDQP